MSLAINSSDSSYTEGVISSQVEGIIDVMNRKADEVEERLRQEETEANEFINLLNDPVGRLTVMPFFSVSEYNKELDAKIVEIRQGITKMEFFRDQVNREEAVPPSLKGRLIQAVDRTIKCGERALEMNNRIKRALQSRG